MTEQISDPSLKSALVVVAHADDPEYGCSGTVAQLIRKGWEVTYVLCTDGSKGSDDLEMTQ
jgi:LmbE family N-acetylglucosaminyl deacetylase